jgi:phosphatidylserine decarboxylase
MPNLLFSESPVIGYGIILILLALITMGSLTIPIFIVIVGILACMLYFYRDPNDVNCDVEPNAVLAPSYGTVQAIRYDGNYAYVAIFLSPMDVHQQYYPANGRIIDRIYDFTGKFKVAFDINKSRFNEKKIHVLETEHGIMLITQIAGLLVRSIVSDEDVNTDIKAGQRFGMIKFGSRVDIAIPRHNGFELLCRVGDKLKGGIDIIGRWNNNHLMQCDEKINAFSRSILAT